MEYITANFEHIKKEKIPKGKVIEILVKQIAECIVRDYEKLKSCFSESEMVFFGTDDKVKHDFLETVIMSTGEYELLKNKADAYDDWRSTIDPLWKQFKSDKT